MTASTPLPPPPPPSRAVAASEGALAALGLVGLGSAIATLPYLTEQTGIPWTLLLHVAQGLAVACAGVLALVSLLGHGGTRAAAAIVALLGGVLGLVSVAAGLVRWLPHLGDSIPGAYVAGNLLNFGSGAAQALVAVTLGVFLLVRRA